MLTITIRIAAVFLMIMAGIIARKRGFLDSATTSTLSKLVIVILYPALIYSSLTTAFTFSDLLAKWHLPAGAILVMVTGFVVGLVARRLITFQNAAERRAFHFQCSVNNYIFLPLPLIMMYFGNDGVASLIFSTVGSEIGLWTIGIVALMGLRFEARSLKHLINMPMGAVVAALLTLALMAVSPARISQAPFLQEVGKTLLQVLDVFGRGTVPLAMMVAGSRMAELKPDHLRQFSQLSVVFLRLILIPVCTLGLLQLLPLPVNTRQIIAIVAIMPSSVASVMLSDLYGADREFAATSVLMTHLFSLITIPLWMLVIL